MNLNDFVVIPSSKAKSAKLSGRNLRELRMETVTLAQESERMEERLQQLKESMIREKMERGRSEGYRWKSGKAGTLTNTSSANRNKENTFQTHAAGRLKIRVLKDEPLKGPVPPASQPTPSQTNGRKQRARGKICGQCEVMAAGLACPECGEDYCVGCFARFHQKGALKLHRMVPIQAELQTHVSALDVVSSFQRQVDPRAGPGAPGHAPAHAALDQTLPPRPRLHPDSHGGLPHPHHHDGVGPPYPHHDGVGSPHPHHDGAGPPYTHHDGVGPPYPHHDGAGPPYPHHDGVGPPAAASSGNRRRRGGGGRRGAEHSQVLRVNHTGRGGEAVMTDTDEDGEDYDDNDDDDDDSTGDDDDDDDEDKDRKERRDGGEGDEGLSLLHGVYDEEESALDFQRALREWRGHGSQETGETGETRETRSRRRSGGGDDQGEGDWRPGQDPPAMAAIGTQAGLPSNRGAEGGGGGGARGGGGGGRGAGAGGGGGGERVPINVVFHDDSLCYLDRLLLKRHRRTPVEPHRLKSDPGLASTSVAHTLAGGADHTLTGEDEDFRRYCASLFEPPTTRGSAGLLRDSAAPCLTIEVLNQSSRGLPEAIGGESITRSSAMRPPGQQPPTEGCVWGAPTGPPGPRAPPTSGPPGKLPPASAESGESKSHQPPPRSAQQPRSPRRPASAAAPRTAGAPAPGRGRSLPVSPAAAASPHLPRPGSPPAPRPASSPSGPAEARGSPQPADRPPLRSTFTLSPSGSVDGALLPEVDAGPTPRAASDLREAAEPPGSRTASPLLPGREGGPPPAGSPPPGSPSRQLSSPEVRTSALIAPHWSPRSPLPARGPADGWRPWAGGRRSSGPSGEHPCTPAPPAPAAADPRAVGASTPEPPGETSASPPSELRSSPPSRQDSHRLRNDPPSRQSPGPSTPTDVEQSSDAEDDMSLDDMSLDSLGLRDGPSSDGEDTEGDDPGGPGQRGVREEDAIPASVATSVGSLVPKDPAPGPEAGPEPGPGPGLGPGPGPGLGPGLGPEPEPGQGPGPGPGLGPEPEPGQGPGPGPGLGPEPEPGQGPGPGLGPEPEPGQGPVPGPDAETGETGLQSQPSKALQALARRAASPQEQPGGSLDGFLTLGLDLRSVQPGPSEHAEPDRDNQPGPQVGPDAFSTGSWRPSSSIRARAQDHLVSTVMMDSQRRPAGEQHRSAPPTVRRDMSTPRPRLSGSPRYPPSGRSTSARRPTPRESLCRDPVLSLSLSRLPPPSRSPLPPPSPCRPRSGGVAPRPVSRAAQEILDICGVERAGCGDPHWDPQGDAETLVCLEQELRLMVHDAGAQPVVMSSADRRAPGQRRTDDLTGGGVSQEQRESDEEMWRDRQSVLSLP